MDKYINLKQNGRLYPSWILKNFPEYKLEEIFNSENDDPCNAVFKKKIKEYQEFISKYLHYTSPYRNILIMHGLGTGKTVTFINLYNVLYNYIRGWNIFILIKASLRDDPWEKDLKEWLSKDDYDDKYNHIKFISYDSPYADKEFMNTIKETDASKKSLYVVDEAHNFIRNVYSNISSKEGKRAQSIYEYMIQDSKDNEHTRIVLLSGTPAINKPFELALLFNLLRPSIFTKSEQEFNREFISQGTHQILNPIMKNLFQRRILGLVSYYKGGDPLFYARKKMVFVDVVMSQYQDEICKFYEAMEKKMASKQLKAGPSNETYMSYTRQANNFVFPHLGHGVSGDTRPRPNHFSISEHIANKVEKGKEIDTNEKVDKYIKAMNTYTTKFDGYLEGKKHSKPTLNDNVLEFQNKYNNNYDDFLKKSKKSELFEAMHDCSAKFTRIIFTILVAKGPVLVYSNYVLMEGLEVFKIYLKHFGFTELTEKNQNEKSLKFTEFHGMISKKQRLLNKDIYNKKENIYGEYCKIILISPAGSEGLNLKSTREVHIIEPYWHETRIEQMIGRAIRNCSHSYLPKKEREVTVYRYKSVRLDGKMTTDQYIEDLSRSKEGLIQSFLDAIKEAAIDCELFKKQNKMNKCFKFNEESLFDEQIGPAYVENFKDDKKNDNGLNSVNSEEKQIKVIKIQAVIEEANNSYSKPLNYWYSPDTHVIYDNDLHYPVGKIKANLDKIPIKFENYYIIDKLIPIPMIKKK